MTLHGLLALPVLRPACGVGVHHIPTAVTVLPPMTLAMAVENGVTRNKCAGPRPYMLYQSQLQMQKLTDIVDIEPTTLSLMRFTRCNLQPKESMLISTSVPHHHHLHQSTSDFKLTLVVRAIQFMLMTLISCHLSKLNPQWFDYWIIQNPSSQLEAKSHCTALVVACLMT